MPGPDEIAAALTTAEAEVARLTAQLDAANAAEAAALVALTQATTALTAERDRRTRDLALTKERIRPLHLRGEAGLAARHTAQRVAQEAVRLGLGAVGFIGWLMAATRATSKAGS